MKWWSASCASMLVACGVARAGDPALITTDEMLAARMRQAGPGELVRVIVSLDEPGELVPAARGVVQRLRERAPLARAGLEALLRRQGLWDRAAPRVLWATGALALSVPAGFLGTLATAPGVRDVRLDAALSLPKPPRPQQSGLPSAATSPNLIQLGAPELWTKGVNGQGVVVANVDTGVDGTHPDLAARWRGGANSWFDSARQHSAPADLDGHGTQTMGLLAGGSAGGSAIGIAPGARWIAARVFDDTGAGSISGMHEAFQWLLDPDGDPATHDAPDVVSVSLSFPEMRNRCWREFARDLELLRAEGIAVVMAAGNDGPGSSEPPANNPGSLAIGAVDSASRLLPSSSYGPSPCRAGPYPALVAPGDGVLTADRGRTGLAPYTVVSGTSFATPQVAGLFALLRSGEAAATVEEIETALESSAAVPAGAGAGAGYGYGIPRAGEALSALQAARAVPAARDDFYLAEGPTALSLAAPGVLANDRGAAPLRAQLLVAPANGTVDLAASGAFVYTARRLFRGDDQFTYLAENDAGASPATVFIHVRR